MKTLILILGIILTTSCSDDDDKSIKQNTFISFTEIGKGALFGNGAEGISQSNMVITNSGDWQNLMNQMNSVNMVTNEFSETNVDFSSYTVIAVFLEVKTSGWEVEISSIEEETSNIIVSKTENEADNFVITQPFHVVKIPVTSKPIIFE